MHAEPSDGGGRICAEGVVVVVHVRPARGTGPSLVIGQHYKAGPRETIRQESEFTVEAGPGLRPRAVQHDDGRMPLVSRRDPERSGERNSTARENDGFTPVGLDPGCDPSPMDGVTEHQLPRHSGAVAPHRHESHLREVDANRWSNPERIPRDRKEPRRAPCSGFEEKDPMLHVLEHEETILGERIGAGQ